MIAMNRSVSRSCQLSLAMIAVALSLTPSWGIADQSSYLNVRIPSQFAPSVTKIIAEAGVPETLELQAGQSVDGIVAARCNAIDPYYMQILLSSNSELRTADLSALPAAMKVTFPACPVFPSTETAKVKVPDKSTFWNLTRAANVPMKAVDWDRLSLPKLKDVEILEGRRLTEAIGQGSATPDDASFEYFSKLNSLRAVEANPDIADLGSLKVGQSVNSLFSKPQWSTIKLKDGVDATSLAATLKKAMREDNDSWRKNYTNTNSVAAAAVPAEGDFEPAPETRLITSVQSSAEAATCDETESGKDWSNTRSLLRRIASVNAGHQTAPFREADILIVDSGINIDSLLKAPFTIDRLQSVRWRDVEASKLSAYARGQTYGVNLAANIAEALRNLPNTVQGYSDAWHGLSVANVALFGFDSSEVTIGSGQQLPATISRIAFANVVNPTQKDIPPSVLPEALAYAERNALAIMNVSLAANNSAAPWVDALRNNEGRTLVVVAAGNDHTDLEQVGVWPARYGGEPDHGRGGRVITVGAYDGKRRLAAFSNFGKSYVDLLAPGCDVPTLRAGMDPAHPQQLDKFRAVGTSFAAPLVSNLAGWLWAYGLSTDEIKARLLVSVDLSMELKDKVYSGGTLNPGKALSLWTDSIEVQTAHGTEIRFGKLDVRSLKIVACGQTPRSSALRKLSVVSDGAGKRFLRYIEAEPTTVDRLLMKRSDYCETFSVAPETVTFVDGETQQSEQIQTTNLVDYVAAEFPGD